MPRFRTLSVLALALIGSACADSLPVSPTMLQVRPSALFVPPDGGGEPPAPGVGTVTTPIDPVPLGAAVPVTATVGGATSATVVWGDSVNTRTAATVNPSTGEISGSYTYATPGIYTVSVEAVVDGQTVTVTAPSYVVVYDPAGGFVTGGGWIDSPAGAYHKDASLVGRATFGFVAKAKRGQVVPTGNTEFQFHATRFNFKSSAYDWLVVSGTKATFKGTGTLNGEGDYAFMLTATDDKSADRFRIRIWDRVSGGIVYDNQVGGDQADGATPSTMLAGGNIVVHVK